MSTLPLQDLALALAGWMTRDERLVTEYLSKRTSWIAFLRAHWGAIAAMDFFTVEVVTLARLVRYHVLFVIDLASRRVEIAGIVHPPHDAWMKQCARNLTDLVDGFLREKRYLIMDRDPKFTSAFRSLLTSTGIKSVRLPARSPNLNGTQSDSYAPSMRSVFRRSSR